MPQDIGAAGQTGQAPFDWRAHLPVHPAADEYPLLRDIDPERFAAVAEDIRLNGLRAPIIAWSPAGGRDDGLAVDAPAVLDGRNRLDILAYLGLLYETPDHHVGLRRWTNGIWSDRSGSRIDSEFHHVFGGDPYKISASYNVHRRDLNAEHKRGLIAGLLKREPEASNNSIAKRLAVDDKTVAAVRREMEANSEIPNKPNRVEANGRRARGRRAGSTKKAEKPVLTITGIKQRARALGVRVKSYGGTHGINVVYRDSAWGGLNLDGANARLDEIEREIGKPQTDGAGNDVKVEETQAPSETDVPVAAATDVLSTIADSDEEIGTYLEALGPDRFFSVLDNHAPKIKNSLTLTNTALIVAVIANVDDGGLKAALAKWAEDKTPKERALKALNLIVPLVGGARGGLELLVRTYESDVEDVVGHIQFGGKART
jgi:hypothetical protein